MSLSGCASAPPAPAARDRFPLDPREGLAGPFDASVEKGWRALASGDARRAGREFERAASGVSRRAAEIGNIEALVLSSRAEEALSLCSSALSGSGPTLPLWTPARSLCSTGEPSRPICSTSAHVQSPGGGGWVCRSGPRSVGASHGRFCAPSPSGRLRGHAIRRAQNRPGVEWNPGAARSEPRARSVRRGERASALITTGVHALGALDEASEPRSGDLALMRATTLWR